MPHTIPAAAVANAMKNSLHKRNHHPKDDAVVQHEERHGSRTFRFLARHRTSCALPVKANTFSMDDRSITSELTVESSSVLSNKKVPLHQTEEVPVAAGKRVRFDLKSNVMYGNHVLPVEDCHELWLSNEEQQSFRASVMMIVKTIVRADTGVTGLTYSAVIQNVYLACQSIDFEIDTSILTRKEERTLRDMFKNKTGQPYIGLERRIVRSIAKDKQERRMKLVGAIRTAQARRCGLPMNDAAVEALRMECERLSLCSRLFARHLAQAQATAMADDPYYSCDENVVPRRHAQ